MYSAVGSQTKSLMAGRLPTAPDLKSSPEKQRRRPRESRLLRCRAGGRSRRESLLDDYTASHEAAVQQADVLEALVVGGLGEPHRPRRRLEVAAVGIERHLEAGVLVVAGAGHPSVTRLVGE